MDPTKCWQEMADALRRQDLVTADERARALKDWLDKGGCLPQCHMTRPELLRQLRHVLSKDD
jgi:hypothetical protein